MRVLGIHIAKGQLFYAVLEGTMKSPKLLKKERIVTADPKYVPQLMDWFETQFSDLLGNFEPDKIAYRLTLDPKKVQIFTSEFPLGILNLLAYRQSIPIVEFTPRSFVPSKIGLEKKEDIYQACDTVLGIHPPYWNDSQKHAVLAAWFEL